MQQSQQLVNMMVYTTTHYHVIYFPWFQATYQASFRFCQLANLISTTHEMLHVHSYICAWDPIRSLWILIITLLERSFRFRYYTAGIAWISFQSAYKTKRHLSPEDTTIGTRNVSATCHLLDQDIKHLCSPLVCCTLPFLCTQKLALLPCLRSICNCCFDLSTWVKVTERGLFTSPANADNNSNHSVTMHSFIAQPKQRAD